MTSEQIEISRLRGELRASVENVSMLEREAERLRISVIAKLDEARHWRRLYAEELESHDRTKAELERVRSIAMAERPGCEL